MVTPRRQGRAGVCAPARGNRDKPLRQGDDPRHHVHGGARGDSDRALGSRQAEARPARKASRRHGVASMTRAPPPMAPPMPTRGGISREPRRSLSAPGMAAVTIRARVVRVFAERHAHGDT